MSRKLRSESGSTTDQVLAAYERVGFATCFSAGSNRYWVVKGNRQINDLREMLEPRRVERWRTAKLPRDIAVGDRVIFWESAPHLHFVGIGEVGAWEREKDEDGNSHFWLMYLSHALDSGPTIQELRKEPLFEDASFLKAAVAATVFPLTAEQAQFVVSRLGAIDTDVHRVWPDLSERTMQPNNAPRAVAAAIMRAKPEVSGNRPLPRTGPSNTASLTPGQTYRILSVRPPFAWSIIFAGKDIENRSWTTPYRGPILIHASSHKYTGDTLAELREEIAETSGLPIARVPTEFPRSTILGMVDVVDCVNDHGSAWAQPDCEHWVLENPRPLDVAVTGVDGKLNLWNWTCPSIRR